MVIFHSCHSYGVRSHPCGDPRWDPTTGLVWSATGSTNRGIKRKKEHREPCFLRGALPCFTHLYPSLPIRPRGVLNFISPCSTTTFQADNDSRTSGQPVATYRQSTCAAVQTEQPSTTNNEQPEQQQKKHIISSQTPHVVFVGKPSAHLIQIATANI